MADHCLPVARTAHIKLKAVASVLQTKLKRCQRIFRNLAESPRPAMPQKKRSSLAVPIPGLSSRFQFGTQFAVNP